MFWILFCVQLKSFFFVVNKLYIEEPKRLIFVFLFNKFFQEFIQTLTQCFLFFLFCGLNSWKHAVLRAEVVTISALHSSGNVRIFNPIYETKRCYSIVQGEQPKELSECISCNLQNKKKKKKGSKMMKLLELEDNTDIHECFVLTKVQHCTSILLRRTCTSEIHQTFGVSVRT